MRAAAQAQVHGRKKQPPREQEPEAIRIIKKYARDTYRSTYRAGAKTFGNVFSYLQHFYLRAVTLQRIAWEESKGWAAGLWRVQKKEKKKYNPGLAKKLAADESRAAAAAAATAEGRTEEEERCKGSKDTCSTTGSSPTYNSGNATRLRNAVNKMENAGKGKQAQQLKREIKLLKEQCKRECGKKSKAEKKEIEERYEKQERELIAKYEAGAPPPTQAEEDLAMESMLMSDNAPKEMSSQQLKAQRKREQKAERLAEAKRERDADLEGVIPLSTIETEKMDKQRTELGFKLKDIASDGNCLFRAFEHQLTVAGLPDVPTHQRLRADIADYLAENKDEFQPFMEEPHDTDEGYAQYVESIRGNMWGGDVEISAFSKIYEMRIEVYQGQGEPVIHMGEDFPKGPVRLSFHRYLYTCPHYNSLLLDTSGSD